jgi:hypothetical protein
MLVLAGLGGVEEGSVGEEEEPKVNRSAITANENENGTTKLKPLANGSTLTKVKPVANGPVSSVSATSKQPK